MNKYVYRRADQTKNTRMTIKTKHEDKHQHEHKHERQHTHEREHTLDVNVSANKNTYNCHTNLSLKMNKHTHTYMQLHINVYIYTHNVNIRIHFKRKMNIKTTTNKKTHKPENERTHEKMKTNTTMHMKNHKHQFTYLLFLAFPRSFGLAIFLFSLGLLGSSRFLRPFSAPSWPLPWTATHRKFVPDRFRRMQCRWPPCGMFYVLCFMFFFYRNSDAFVEVLMSTKNFHFNEFFFNVHFLLMLMLMSMFIFCLLYLSWLCKCVNAACRCLHTNVHVQSFVYVYGCN